jgi:rod shape-determining protein MreD
LKSPLASVAVHGAVIVIAALAQTTWLARLSIRGAAPDIVLLWVVALGTYRGAEVGTLAGAASGLLQDLFGGLTLGLAGVVKLIAGFAAGLMRRSVALEGIVVPVFVAVGATVASEAMFHGAAAITGAGLPPLPDVAERTALAACYNAVISPVVFSLFTRIERRLERVGSDE